MKNKKTPKIAFILNFFPILSETFIFSELQNLYERGVDFTIFALFQSGEYEKRNDIGALGERVVYLSPFKVLPLISAHLYLLMTRPMAYLKTWNFARQQSCHKVICMTVFKYFFVYKKDRKRMPKELRQDMLLHFVLAAPLAHSIIKGQYGLIHGHYADTATSFAMLLAKLCGLEYSFTTHATDLFVDPYHLPLKINHAKFVVTCTEYNRNYIVENIKDSATNKVFLNYHGVDSQVFKPFDTPKIENEKTVIMTVGRLVPKKGFDLLLKACKHLLVNDIPFECRIVGNGPLLESLQSMSNELGISEHVQFMGAMPPDKVKELYSTADMFVLPCRITERGDRDGIPNVVAEAMAMQLPVVSTTISGIPEVIEHGVSGFLVPPENPKELIKVVTDLCNAPEKRTKVGIKAREHIREIFEKQEKIDELVDLFITQLAQ